MLSSALRGLLSQDPHIVDYVAVIPDTLWVDRGRGKPHRYTRIDDSVRFVDWLAERRPIVGHSVGLSIASADRFDTEHVCEIARWQATYDFPWHSDHLSYTLVADSSGGEQHTALQLPAPCDAEVLNMLAERVKYVQRQVNAPFLIENNVYYVDIPDQDMTEPAFLNAVAARTGCSLLLDLHNLYTNACNHAMDPYAYLDELDLDSVVEVHIAGGEEFAGMYTDAHSGACPEKVWDLLQHLLSRAPNVCGVTYELEPSYFSRLGNEGIREQLCRARAIWDHRR
jgi:uncharacterized protein (UPF0276 family)